MGQDLVCSFKLVHNIAEEAKTRALDITGPALKDQEITQQCKKHELVQVWRKQFLPGIEPRTSKTICLTLPLG